jgi:hypothetical protein
MPSMEEIKPILSQLDGASTFFAKKEIKELPSILWENEMPEAIIQGRYQNSIGVLVCTNKRLIFINKGVFNLKVEDFPLNNVSSIQYETGMIFGKITIFASGNRAEIDQVEKKRTRTFAEYARSKISASSSTEQPQSTIQASVGVDSADIMIEKLEKLAALKDRGVLTEDEFLTQKEKILNS